MTQLILKYSSFHPVSIFFKDFYYKTLKDFLYFQIALTQSIFKLEKCSWGYHCCCCYCCCSCCSSYSSSCCGCCFDYLLLLIPSFSVMVNKLSFEASEDYHLVCLGWVGLQSYFYVKPNYNWSCAGGFQTIFMEFGTI